MPDFFCGSFGNDNVQVCPRAHASLALSIAWNLIGRLHFDCNRYWLTATGSVKTGTMNRETRTDWFVYMLRCSDQSLYTGITTDLERRLSRHNDGVGSRYTRARLPVELVYTETAKDRGGALRRESQIKRLPTIAKRALIGE